MSAKKWASKAAPKIVQQASQKLNNEFAGEGALTEINIDKIRIDFSQPRTSLQRLGLTPDEIIAFRELSSSEKEKRLSEETEKAKKLSKVVELANAIQAHGLINPITVVRDGKVKEQPYILETGGRRYLALRLLGKEKTRAFYREDDPTSIRSRSRQFIENYHHERLSLAEDLAALENLNAAYHLEHGRTLKAADIQKEFSVNRRTAFRFQNMLYAADIVKAAILDEHLVVRHDIDIFSKFTTQEEIDQYLAEKKSSSQNESAASPKMKQVSQVPDKPISLGKTVHPDVLVKIMSKVLRKAEFKKLVDERDTNNPKELKKIWMDFLLILEEEEA